MSRCRTVILKGLDSTLGALLCRLFSLAVAARQADSPTASAPADTIRRILVIRPGGMGDMIILLPMIRFLQERYPKADITIVCEKRNVDVLKLAGLEKQTLVYDSNPFGFLVHLAKGNFDVAFDTEQFHHFSAIFAFLSGAPMRIGFKINPCRNPLYTHLINYAPDGPEGAQFANLLAPLRIGGFPRSLEGSLTLSDTRAEASSVLRDGIPDSRQFLVMHPGSSHVYKQWDPRNFAQLAERLRQNCGLSTVLLGDREDSRLAERILKEAPRGQGSMLSFAGKVSLQETGVLIKRSRLFVGTDSGLAHLAIALNVPAVVLFGPTDHQKWGFRDARHIVVKKDLPCSPCFMFGYHRHCRALACMRNITVEDVLAACQQILERKP